MATRRVLVPPSLAGRPPVGGGHLARVIYDFSGHTMGTHWLARVAAPAGVEAPELGRIIREALGRVVGLMSPWEAASDLGRFRQAAAGERVRLAPETCVVLGRALELAELTGGLYQPAIGGLVDRLGFGPSDPQGAVEPDSAAAAAERAVVDRARLSLDAAGGTVVQPGGVTLDLCSIAKGYAVDLVIERLRTVGVEACFVEIGGEARGLGCRPDGNPWWCLVAPPREVGHGLPVTVVAACDVAVATSGNSLRSRRLADGSRLGHILPGRAGVGLDTGLERVTVLAPTCMDADAYATALFVSGADEGLSLAAGRGIAALLVERTADGGWRERWSPRLADYF